MSVEAQQKMAVHGLELLLQRNYPEAQRFIRQILQQDPGGLLGYFGFMAYSQIRNFENYDFRFESDYEPWAGKGRDKALKIYHDPASGSWDLLLAGGTLGISGFEKGHHEKWFQAFRDGQAATQALRLAYRKEPVADPLLGIGLYDYWRSYYTRLLRFLPFFPDRRREGREEILQAATQGEVVGPIAMVALAFLDYHEKRYEAALRTTHALLQRYPQNTIILMLEGQTFIEMKQYQPAIDDFEKILAIDPSLTKSHLFLGLTLAKAGKERQEARDHLLIFLAKEEKASRHWRKRAEQALKKL